MRTVLSIALALLCVVGAPAQQAPDADAAKAAVRIRATELQRRTPNGSNAVVTATPQPAATPVAPSVMLPPPVVAASPSATATPAPVPVSAAPPPAPMATTNTVTAVTVAEPNAKQTLQQDTSSSDDTIGSSLFLADEFKQPYTTRDLIKAITADGIAVPKASSEIESLNNLLSGGSLRSRFPSVQLSDKAMNLIERESTLSSEDRTKLNRLILEAAYPQKCPIKDVIDFEFMNTDIQQVLAFYGQLTHRSAIMQQGLNATITLPHTPPLNIEEAIGAVESVLLINGFAIVPMGDKFFKVVPSPYGPQEGLPVFTQDAKSQQFDRLVAQVVKVKCLDVAEVQRALGGTTGGAMSMPSMPGSPQQPGGSSGRIFMHPYGQIIAMPRSSALLIIDTALNVSRLKQIIEYMDTPGESKMETRVYVLENAGAVNVSLVLSMLIGQDRSGPTSMSRGSMTQQTTGPAGGPAGSPTTLEWNSSQRMFSDDTIVLGKVLISFDLRTNAIIIITKEINFPFFEKLIKALDVKTDQDFKTRVFFLNYADATDMSVMLYQLVQGAEPQSIGGRVGGTAGSPYTSRTGTSATGGRTGGVGGSGSRSSSGARTSSATGSRSGSSSLGSGSRSGGSRSSTSRNAAAGSRATAPSATGTTGAGITGITAADVPQTIQIIPDVRNNALVIFAPEQDLELLNDVIKQLDVFPPQVAIDVVVAEVNMDKDTTFGVDLFQKGLGKGGVAGGGVSTPGGGLAGANRINNTSTNGFTGITKLLDPSSISAPELLPAGLTGGLTYFARFFGDDLRAVITALSGDSKFKVLQTPHLYTSNNQTARVFVGRTVPVVTSTQTTINSDQTRSNYENVDVGVGLEVTPLINPDGVVTFNVYQTYDNVRLDTVKIDNNNVPTFDRREAEAVAVTCKDGQIIIMGGLTTNEREQQENKVPVLGDIPVLGYLFKKTEWKETKRELVFFLRPKVIRTIEEAQRYTWGRIEKSKDLRTMPLRDVEGYTPVQDKRHNEKLKAIDRFDKSEKF